MADTETDKKPFETIAPWALKLIQGCALIAVVFLLIDKLHELGWQDVYTALPSSPLYYALFLAMYFAPPIAEWFVYQTLWGPRVKSYFRVFLKMRVLNLAVLSYMGEAFIAYWGHKTLGLRARKAASNVKDSNILSALASNSFTLLLVSSFFLTGQLGKITSVAADYEHYFGIAAGIGFIIVPIVIIFQKHILSTEPKVSRKIFSIHLIRFLLVMLFQLGQWTTAIPEAPIETWLLLITAQMVLTRIPFLPNTDLMFMGLGITLMGFMEGPETALAAMFLAAGALSQILNLLVFIYSSLPSWLSHIRYMRT